MEYRLYIMDGMGKLGGVEHLSASDDRQAIKMAFEKKLPVSCEVWDRERCVAVILAHLEQED